MILDKKYSLNIIFGPLIFIAGSVILNDLLGFSGAIAVSSLFWMVFWWVTRPVNMTVTAILPIIINTVFNIIPMDHILKQYASPSLVLIFGAGLLSLAMANTGLDKRIALKALSLIGPSMKSQIVVWFCASTVLSTFMPNVAVCAIYCPIAVAMLNAAGYTEIKKSRQANLILLAIGWGAGIGGVGSPLGGAMNITAISYLNEYLGKEFMYFEWAVRMVPYMIIITIILLFYMIYISKNCEAIHGSKEYFRSLLNDMPAMSIDERISGAMFVIAMVLAFIRPLYADIMPAAEPAYIFLFFGFIMFFIIRKDHRPFIVWEEAQKETLWGMMILFGGGVALGTLINDSGAALSIGRLFALIDIKSELLLITIIAVMAVLLSELTNSTVCAAVLTPVVLNSITNIGLDPIPYWFCLCIAMNAEFLLPLSVRAIPVSYGLDPDIMFKKGLAAVLIRAAVCILYVYLCLCFIPQFGILIY